MNYITHDHHFVVVDRDVVEPNHPPETEKFLLGKTGTGMPWEIQKYASNIDVLYPKVDNERTLTYSASNNINRFMLAVHEAYDKHLSLDLCIDDIWTLIRCGWIIQIKSNPEKYRAKFVKHLGVKNIAVDGGNFVLYSPENDWNSVLGLIDSALYEEIPDMQYNYIACNWLSSTRDAQLNTAVDNMSLLDSYMSYDVTTNCGIKSITVRGDKSDWAKLKLRVKELARYDLEWWSKPLLSVIDTIVSTHDAANMSTTARSVLDQFWRSIYCIKTNPIRNVLGWINVFFPWLLVGSCGTPSYIKNPMVWHWQSAIALGQSGNNLDRFPLCLSVVPVAHTCEGTQYDVEFISGYLFVSAIDLPRGEIEGVRTVLRPRLGHIVRRPIV